MWIDPRSCSTNGRSRTCPGALGGRRSLLENHSRRRRAGRIKRCDRRGGALDAATWLALRVDRARDDRNGASVAEHSDYAWLIGDEAAVWLARLCNDDRPQLQQLESLRRELPAERARLVVEQCDLRRRAVDKFGDRAARMFFTRVLLEQATDCWIARYKAERLAAAGAAALGDYCCGIGGDLLALAERGAGDWLGFVGNGVPAGARRTAIDAAAVRCGDVTKCYARRRRSVAPRSRSSGGRPAHVGSQRLLAGARPRRPLAARPMRAAPSSSPRRPTRPTPGRPTASCEWITRDRECRQQVVWFGPLATRRGKRRATVVGTARAASQLSSGTPRRRASPRTSPGAFLFDPDPAVLAAGLLGALAAAHGWSTLGAGGAYLTGDARVDRFACRRLCRARLPAAANGNAVQIPGRARRRPRGNQETRRRRRARRVAATTETARRQRGDRRAHPHRRREVAIVAERIST